ncbi:MAG: PQQ-binding-like beta-propeller repeat protein [Pirellulales bacterium]
MKTTAAFFLTIAIGYSLPARGGENWPQWRGADGLGHAAATDLPQKWSEADNVTWKTHIPGRGWSSPVIENGRIWLTTAVDKAASAEDKKQRLKANTGSQPLVVSELVSLRAVCVDLRSGKVLHDVEVLAEKDPQWIHALNSYASPTPVIEDDKLYCHFGAYGTGCLDTKSLKVLWTNRDQRIMHENGPGSSPILWGDHLIFHCDGSDKQYIAALNKNTGKTAWNTRRSGKMNANPQLQKSYATPLVTTIDGRPHVLSPAADWLYSYDPKTGKELWKIAYGRLGFSNVPRPVLGNGMIYLSTGYMKAEMLAIKLTSRGGSIDPQIAWRFGKQVPTISSPVLVGNHLYFVSDKGIATCLDATTGGLLWAERLGGNFAASPMFADGKLFFPSRTGDTVVIKPGAEFQLMATNTLESGFMASPAAIDGALILRSEKAIYRIGTN